MSGFIVRAACRGHRPSHYNAYEGRERPRLLGLLLKDRGVARYIVAPDGYGKTSLAIAYAETMFSWSHTFWVNAASPCFIRDLDEGTIASSCLSFDGEAALVVFDAVPSLDSARAEAFSGEIDKLLAKNCEVVVTCSPACDTSGAFQLDRIRLGARDMLLDDDEADSSRSFDERQRVPSETLSSAHRMPALVWHSGDDCEEQFAKAVLYDELPSDLLLVVGSALVLHRGSFAELSSAIQFDKTRLEELAADYPHIGFDGELDEFEAPLLSMSHLATSLKKRLPDMVRHSAFESVEQLVLFWAETMVKAGRAARACDLIGEVYPRNRRARWLLDHVYDLVRQACILPVFRLAADRDRCKGESKVRLCAIEALCRRILGDAEGAFNLAKRYAFDGTVPRDVHICCLLIVARIGDRPLVERACAELEMEVGRGDVGSHPMRWALLAEARCASLRGVGDLCDLWIRFRDRGVDGDTLSLCASWLFSLVDSSCEESAGDSALAIRSCERFVRERLSALPSHAIDYYSASAGLAMEEAHERGVRYDEGPLEAVTLIKLRNLEMSVLAQRRLFEEEGRMVPERRGEWAFERSGEPFGRSPVALKPQRASSAPVLTLRLFGSFDAAIGGTPIGREKFRRRNTRSLLAVLASSQGREVSRDMVVRSLWPRSTAEAGRKNFYTVWSSLRSALSLPDGSCPYLVRHQFGCGLEPRLVNSDVERLEEICRELLFGVPNQERWSQLFSEIDRDYSSELMPSERKNSLIVQARNEYRNRLVDALVAATTSIADTETPQWGIWFARAALKHDETREDAYVALMRAQVASNQRTAAMMTYLTCRRALSDQLGIDPSPETTTLYESLLDGR